MLDLFLHFWTWPEGHWWVPTCMLSFQQPTTWRIIPCNMKGPTPSILNPFSKQGGHRLSSGCSLLHELLVVDTECNTEWLHQTHTGWGWSKVKEEVSVSQGGATVLSLEGRGICFGCGKITSFVRYLKGLCWLSSNAPDCPPHSFLVARGGSNIHINETTFWREQQRQFGG